MTVSISVRCPSSLLKLNAFRPLLCTPLPLAAMSLTASEISDALIVVDALSLRPWTPWCSALDIFDKAIVGSNNTKKSLWYLPEIRRRLAAKCVPKEAGFFYAGAAVAEDLEGVQAVLPTETIAAISEQKWDSQCTAKYLHEFCCYICWSSCARRGPASPWRKYM
jgi:hypothetical protein